MTKDPTPRDIAPLDPDARPEPPVAAGPRHHQRFDKVPPGFIRFRGKKDPVGNERAIVEIVVRTAEGLGFAGPRRVHPEEWTVPASEHGSIAAYRLVESGKQ